MTRADLARFALPYHALPAGRRRSGCATLAKGNVGIVGGHPESGVRVDLVRPSEGGPPWRYEGEATTSRERVSVKADVSAAGEISVELAPDASGLADRVRLFVRAAWKHARNDGLPPPRRIVRWRQED